MRLTRIVCRCGSLAFALLSLVVLISIPGRAASPSAKELLASGRVDELIPILRQQISRAPDDAEAYNLLCRAYFMAEEFDRGIPECERAAALEPRNSAFHLWLGRSYGEKADRSSFMSAASLAKKARAAFERAVELDPSNVEARVDLGEFYAEAPGIVGGGKDKAHRQADALMSLNPVMGHWVQARIAEKEKQPAVAEREYRAEIAVSHSSVRGWLDLGNFFKYAQRYSEMTEALTKMESAPLDHPESLMHGGTLLLRADREYALGVRLLRRYFANGTVEEGPAFKAHAVLGELLEKQGDRQAAIQEIRAALALFQNYPRAREDLKRLEH
jgi:tetratricopeptide (TPR) repeat protein